MTKVGFTWILAILFVICTPIKSQDRKIQNRPYIDQRKFHYGFYIGLHDQGLRLINNGRLSTSTGEQWLIENDNQSMGFNVGILGDWKMTDWLSFRMSPGLYFNAKHIKLRNPQNNAIKTQSMKSAYVTLPIDLKFSGPRFNNYRPYVTAGVVPMYDMISSKHTLIRTTPFMTNIEIGIGCDLYMPFFKLIPELKFSFGLANILDKKRNDLTDEKLRVYTDALNRATTNMVTLNLYFE